MTAQAQAAPPDPFEPFSYSPRQQAAILKALPRGVEVEIARIFIRERGARGAVSPTLEN